MLNEGIAEGFGNLCGAADCRECVANNEGYVGGNSSCGWWAGSWTPFSVHMEGDGTDCTQSVQSFNLFMQSENVCGVSSLKHLQSLE